MDVRGLIESLKEDLTCSICLGYFTDPVTVKCGHTFCTQCLLQCRKGGDDTFTCPECRGLINYRNFTPNKSLQNLSNTGKMLRPHLLQSMVHLTTCDQHGEQEKLFCEEDQISLCESCSLAPEHKHHHVLPMDKAAENCKEDVKVFKQSIICEYEKICQFLQNEEIQHLLKLEEEFKNNMAKLKTNQAKLSQQLQNVKRMILEVEESLDKAPSQMLEVMKIPLERKEEQLLQEVDLDSSTWSSFPITGLRKMLMTFQRDITLYPETAHPHLILSEDLKHIKCGSIPQYPPDNEERSALAFSVLGTQTFTSGKHYWEVEVGDNTDWLVGVCKDSVSQNEKRSILPDDVTALGGYRSINDFFIWKLQNGFFISESIDKMGIFLDYEKGHIAFYNVIEETLLHSATDIIFQGTLRPYFALSLHNEEGTPASLSLSPRITSDQ
ncbi:probable E3 ubiquitin-protein ligase TRIML1 [Dromiciops gliroides]|uniref:probable E3 ubiquitin-protein ligase TRIML1 n=1 Tax=Dromiciops gliroides TaxID=33562 RepID=UPI001CC4E607|nr:probable E3 ubiquitin-protein ligase TRIML1 [Dromiciops gliroides]